MKSRRDRANKGLPLPWEQRSTLLRDAFVGRRPRLLLAISLTVIAIVLVWQAAQRRTQRRMTRLKIAVTEQAVEAFRAQYGRCPHSLRELTRPPLGGAALISEMPVDGWDRGLWILCPVPGEPHSSEVLSAGASGSFWTDDNIW